MTEMTENNEVLTAVSASVPRRWMALGVMWTLGLVVLYLAMTTAPTIGWRLFLLVVGVAALIMAEAMRRATENVIELTLDGLRSSTGEIIAPLDQIDVVHKAMFDMKPSNGFALKLKQPRSRRWQPGLWWALGRRVGVGGMTPGSQAKAMAQMLEAMLAEQRAKKEAERD
ncbi:MAG: hypothetical protein ACU0A6_17070 [Shimia sp.]|jgi:hypothetical protein|uniref:hypothetical protein n=1 Tax=Shimia sp. TaxID=1954381 RepID=UPI0040591BA2